MFQKTNNLLIISRDGTRSALAAKALVSAGFKNIYDVADGFEGGLIELDHIRGMDKGDGVFRHIIILKEGLDLVLTPDEDDVGVEFLYSLYRTFDNLKGGVVATHRINN